MKVALITGVTGQDGSYLAEFLLDKGYEVHGIKRRSSSFNTKRIDHIYEDPHEPSPRFKLHYGDLTDSLNITKIIKAVNPDEIYNLGAMSHVKVSFETPEYVAQVDALGTLRILEAVRLLGMENKTKIYQASTSELYGGMKFNKNINGFYDESSTFYPRSPYGVAKMYSYWIIKNYREAYNIFACNGILFNHESPRRGETFVTRKITRAVAKIALGIKEKFFLGNLDAFRDWGHAKDYVRVMWMILQSENAEDWVIATGVKTSVREFVRMSFDTLGIKIKFKGSGINEKAYVVSCENQKYIIPAGREVLSIDPKYFRPTEVDSLIGDPTKAKQKLGWVPKYDVKTLIEEMIHSDVKLFSKNQI